MSARFNISKAFPENEYISEYTPESLRLLRKSKQPNGISCGSFFKNPPGFSAGALIDQAGLKGKKIGNIGVSEQHGNFLTAEIGVKWQDVLALREYIVSTILEKFQIQLEEEVKIIRSN